MEAFLQHKSQYPSSTPAGAALVEDMLANVAMMTARNANITSAMYIEGFQGFN